MTQDEIIEMAKEAGFWQDLSVYEGLGEHFKAFAKLVAAKEREACAKVLDEMADQMVADMEPSTAIAWVRNRAEAIRARG
jgi:hypothetical protein